MNGADLESAPFLCFYLLIVSGAIVAADMKNTISFFEFSYWVNCGTPVLHEVRVQPHVNIVISSTKGTITVGINGTRKSFPRSAVQGGLRPERDCLALEVMSESALRQIWDLIDQEAFSGNIASIEHQVSLAA